MAKHETNYSATYTAGGVTTTCGVVNAIEHRQTRELITMGGTGADDTVCATGAIPVGAFNVVVRTRVVTALTSGGALSGYTVGDTTTAAMWGTDGSGVAGTIPAGTHTEPGTHGYTAGSWLPFYAALTQVRITSVGGNATGGTMMIQVDYDIALPMTS